jgi:hypothetical protein
LPDDVPDLPCHQTRLEEGEDIEKLEGAFHGTVGSGSRERWILRKIISTQMTANGPRILTGVGWPWVGVALENGIETQMTGDALRFRR